MSKPRLAIPISIQFGIRYLVRTGLLRKLQECARPILLLGWEDASLEAELRQFGEVVALPKSVWGPRYTRVREYLSIWHQLRMATPSTAIRERRADLDRTFASRLRRRASLGVRKAAVLLPACSTALRRSEEQLLWRDTNAAEILQTVRSLKADAVFCLTPFLKDEEMLVRVCALDGLPSCAAILSFDNLTTRSWIPITFDKYLLWNKHNQEQLHRGYPETVDRAVHIVGAPQFDFYWDPSYLWDERYWRQVMGLPPDAPCILFGGGFYSCAPHEPQFLRQLDHAVGRGELDPGTVIIFRRHPVDPIVRWEPVLNACSHVVRDEPWRLGESVLGHTNIRREDIEKLASTLYYAKAHVNVASTMTIDGAIFDRPQIGPAYDDSPDHKYHRAALECYLQEHYLPITHSGAVSVVRSRREMVDAVRSAFLDGSEKRQARLSLVKDVCTFNDGRCADRVAAALNTFISGSRRSEICANVAGAIG